MVFETKRLILREMEEKDCEALLKVFGDPSVMKYYPHAFDQAEMLNWIRRNQERYHSLGFGLWAVCLKENGEVIGDCGLTMQMIHGACQPEIGYHIRADKQRLGYAKEASIAVRDWAFVNTSAEYLYSYMKKTNIASRKTAAAWGSVYLEEYEEEGQVLVVYRCGKEEWKRLPHGQS